MNILGVTMKDETALIIGGVSLVLIFWAGKKVTDGVSGVVKSLNPTSANNIAYKGVNGIGAVITGDDDFSLGSWIYDVLNPGGGVNLPTTFPKKQNGASGSW